MANVVPGMVGTSEDRVRMGWMVKGTPLGTKNAIVMGQTDDERILVVNSEGHKVVAAKDLKHVHITPAQFLTAVVKMPVSVVGKKTYEAIQTAAKFDKKVKGDDRKACERVGTILFGNNYETPLKLTVAEAPKKTKKDKAAEQTVENLKAKLDEQDGTRPEDTEGMIKA